MKSKYFYYYIVGHIFISMIVYYPNIQSKNIYNGFIFAIFIGYFISMFNSYCLINCYNIFTKKDLIFITKKLFSKYIGILIVSLQIITSFVTGIVIYIPLIIVIGSNIMPQTSRMYIAMFILFIYFTAFKNSERSILYSIGLFSLFSIVLIPIIFTVIIKGLDSRFIIGSITHSMKFPFFKMIVSAAYFFNGIESLSVYNTGLEKKSFKVAYLIYGVIGIPLSFLPILVPIGVWGPNAIQSLSFPILATADTVSLDLFIIERTLFLMLPLFISLQILGSTSYFYVANKLFRNTVTSRKVRGLFYTVVILFLLILPTIATDFESMLTVGTIWGYIWFAIICITCPILYYKSKRWVKNTQ
ncbi:hypothetical protein C1I91_21145 [Clostridium manihotivorum]|uniref:Spore germination protein n=2 Tax=Clostridium manihotivorum TaxID=2320868 RepID=A0A410DXV1_9CLOT|nr:hypothetical protein C1I91_21145 [Clostridium manihotivorum]